ncbi:hypothetical protein Poli38472_007019 [Pythium oligandrum]|uniref:Uncharacterized protein n=1 Tax=Pythium oligandrum TaxID=41045 RepID=A0A8K1FFD3_PYTOL|nr:hypothetical protein Poli38472_007019 [Pythium oligandrum]|eukprot:TMW58874.1 hypothetical protein Poli38472_007019 [Pythium oligandrum]
MNQRVLPRRQRQRKLPVMNSSERGKYYRRLNKEMEIQREERVQFLRREVDRLEIQLQITRCLDQLLLPPSLSEVSSFLSHFITERLDASPSTLQNSQVDVRSVTIVGAMEAPVVRLECVLRGQLQPHLVRRLYEFVVGNSFAFEKMMHEEAEYSCTCFFYFSADGRMERFVIERGVSISGLGRA